MCTLRSEQTRALLPCFCAVSTNWSCLPKSAGSSAKAPHLVMQPLGHGVGAAPDSQLKCAALPQLPRRASKRVATHSCDAWNSKVHPLARQELQLALGLQRMD